MSIEMQEGQAATAWSSLSLRLLVMALGVALISGVGLVKAPVGAAEPITSGPAVTMAQDVAEKSSTEEVEDPQRRVLPAVVAAAVWLIVRFGYWVVRFAPQVLQVFNNHLMKRAACQELRRQGNSWGWSFICWGT